jgi:glutaredoxin-related protein
MKLNLRTLDSLYTGELCGQRADAVEWLRGQIRNHESVDIYGADEILASVERVLRSIANAYEAEERQQSLAHGAAAAAGRAGNGRQGR